MFKKYLNSEKLTYVTMYVKDNIISALMIDGKIKLFSSSNPSLTLIEDDVNNSLGALFNVEEIYQLSLDIKVHQSENLDGLINELKNTGCNEVANFFIKFYREIGGVL